MRVFLLLVFSERKRIPSAFCLIYSFVLDIVQTDTNVGLCNSFCFCFFLCLLSFCLLLNDYQSQQHSVWEDCRERERERESRWKRKNRDKIKGGKGGVCALSLRKMVALFLFVFAWG